MNQGVSMSKYDQDYFFIMKDSSDDRLPELKRFLARLAGEMGEQPGKQRDVRAGRERKVQVGAGGGGGRCRACRVETGADR